MENFLPYPWKDLGYHIPPGHPSIFKDATAKKWTLDDDSEASHITFTEPNSEVELYIWRNKIVHSSGQRVVRRYTMPANVLGAAWCSFDEQSDFSCCLSAERDIANFQERDACTPHPTSKNQTKNCSENNRIASYDLCLLMETELAIRKADGYSFTVALPFRASHVWDAGGFLMIQAVHHANLSCVSPVLFSLGDPLDEPKPFCALDVPGNSGIVPQEESLVNDNLHINLVCSGRESQLKGSGINSPFIIAYHVRTCHLFIGGLRSRKQKPRSLGDAALRSPPVADEGDAVKHIYSTALGWTACGSVGMGAADLRRNWTTADATRTLCRCWVEREVLNAKVAPEACLLIAGHTSPCLVFLVDGVAIIHPLSLQEPFLSHTSHESSGESTNGMHRLSIDQAICHIPAKAVSVVDDRSAAGPPRSCLVVLSPDGFLCLYLGTDLLLHSRINPVRGIAQEVVGLRIGVGRRLDLVFFDKRVRRVELSAVSCSLTQRALEQLRCSLSPASYLQIRRRFALLHEQSQSNDWKALSGVLEQIIENYKKLIFPSTQSPTDTDVPDLAWERLLRSQRHNKLQGHGLPTLLLSEKKSVLGLHENESSFCVVGSAFIGKADKSLDANEYSQIAREGLTGLHLLYEDLRLDLAQHQNLPLLARLLLCLCSANPQAKALRDHYIRQHPDLSNQICSSQTSNAGGGSLRPDWVEDVPDIWAWVVDRLEGRNPRSARFLSTSGRPLPNTGRLMALYDALSGGDPVSACQDLTGSMGGGTVRLATALLPASQLIRQTSGMEAAADAVAAARAAAAGGLGNRRIGASGPRKDTAGQSLTVASEDCSIDEDRSLSVLDWKTRCQAVVETMVNLGLGQSDLDSIPCALALPLRDARRVCRADPPAGWPTEAYTLVGRPDLAAPLASRAVLAASQTSAALPGAGAPGTDLNSLLGRANASGTASGGREDSTEVGGGMDVDGTRMDGEIARLRFGRDRRLVDVRRALSASRPVKLRPIAAAVTGVDGAGDLDAHAAYQARLQLLARRTLAIGPGRGMFTLATATALPTEALPIPAIELSGRLPANDALVKLDVSLLPTDFAAWPEFHNGAAAALRLSLGQAAISRTWIAYNRPETPGAAHAGVLMGLGLQGHLGSLARTDLYSYLCQDHELTQVGLMLGVAASRRGTMDSDVMRMLRVHVPALHPSQLPELEVSTAVQTAALMSIGLLYQGSRHRRVTEALLGELGRRATGDRLGDREGYSLAAGLALGLVTLGQGGRAPGLADLQLENQLYRLATGGPDPLPSHPAAAGFSANGPPGCVGGGRSGAMGSGTDRMGGGDAAVSCRIKEGGGVNTDVTGPGAVLALGLMFLRTGNEAVAARLEAPRTAYLLRQVRPDLILLQVIARGLVLWDRVEASEAWILSQMPPLVRNAAPRLAPRRGGPGADPQTSGVGGDEGDDDNQDFGVVIGDEDTLRHVHACMVAGSCLSIGFRFAGSCSAVAVDLLLAQLAQLVARRTGKCDGPRRMDRPLLETCIVCAALAVALVAAGSGHLKVFRALRALRGRVDGEVHYGHHMAIGMAIGLLFLGGGRATLGSSNEAVAALVVALYPRFPIATFDCRYHLQALRHLYVLAVEPRCFEAQDALSGAPCQVPIHIFLRRAQTCVSDALKIEAEVEELVRVTPCLLPEVSSLCWIEVRSPRYWPVRWQVQGNPRLAEALRKGCSVRVLLRAGHLPYPQDPAGLRALLLRAFPRKTVTATGASSMPESGLDGDAAAHALAWNLARESQESKDEYQGAGALWAGALYESVAGDKPEALSAYLSLHHAAADIRARPSWHLAAGLRLTLAWARVGPFATSQNICDSLLSGSFLAALRAEVETAFQALGLPTHTTGGAVKNETGVQENLQDYLMAGRFPEGLAGRRFAAWLVYHGVPSPSRLQRAVASAVQIAPLLAQASAASLSTAVAAVVLPDAPPATAVLLGPTILTASLRAAAQDL